MIDELITNMHPLQRVLIGFVIGILLVIIIYNAAVLIDKLISKGDKK